MNAGYVLVATNHEHYLELAVSCACSLKQNDNKPIALLIAGGLRVPKLYTALFDHIIAFDPAAPFDGDFLRRFKLNDYTPFAKAMHVDSDCLLIGQDIEVFWSKFDGSPFGVMAQLLTEGKCYRDQIIVDDIVSEGIAPGVYVTNWGVFYYENTPENAVLAAARHLVDQHVSAKTRAKLTYLSRPGQLSDEPFWGIALAQLGLDIPKPDYSRLLQVTSPNTKNHCFDFSGRQFSVQKGGLKNVKGQFFHFAEMYPLKEYLEGVIHFRDAMGVPLPSIVTQKNGSISSRDWVRLDDQTLGEMTKDGKTKFRFSVDL